MSRSGVLAFLLIIFLLGLGVSGCGGGGGVGAPAYVIVTPSPVSLNRGDVAQLTASVTDATGATVSTETVSYSSSAPTVASVSPSGLLCGGSWDSTFIHCNPGTPGSATITATASPSGVVSKGITVYVHHKADSIVVGESFPVAAPLSCGSPVPPPAGCISSGATVPNNTERFTALACSNDPAICGGAPPCALDPATLGPFTFVSTNANVATLAPDVTNPNFVAVVTALGPGQSLITAGLSNTTSLPAQFVSCPPKSITIHQASQPPTATTVSVAKGSNLVLSADVVDTNGITLLNTPLTWSSTIPAAASALLGTVVATAVGTTDIVAGCVPPSCSVGLNGALYSNVVTANVTGTANTATVYATSSDAGTTTIIPITNNTAGTAIALPGGFSAPNSFIFAATGSKAFLGSDSGLIILDPVAATTSGVTSVKGKVLAVSPDATKVLLLDTTTPNTVYFYNVQSGTASVSTIAGAVAADFSPDGSEFYIGTSAGHVFQVGTGIFNDNSASGAVTGIALLTNASFAYAADPLTDVFSSCTNNNVGNVGFSSTLIKAAAKPVPPPNNANLQMIAVTGNQITQIDAAPAAPGNPCPAIPTNTAQAYSFPGVAAFTALQLFVTPDSSKAIVTATDVPKLLVYTVGTDAASGTASTIALSGSATGAYTGGVTLDSSTVWVGVAGVNQVQAFSLATGTSLAQVSVGLSPKLVAVRYQ